MSRAPLEIPRGALGLCAEIEALLVELVDLDAPSPLAAGFRSRWVRILELFDRYAGVVVGASDYRTRCARGCSACCRHWIDDVCSFEAELLAAHLRERWPAEVPGWLARFLEAREEFARLADVAGSREVACQAFVRLGRACPLLDAQGACRVYALRPLVCRGFLSFSEPSLCDPAHPGHAGARTYLLDLEGPAHELLDELDLAHERFGSARGLAELLPRALAEPLRG
ncbi:MAG TPA: YkgJ family cysteine cluster protein [Myxococcota bacterium]|nr:YkgJ family cysteine cluster protein [Myxococcota bacterium]HRY97098.1 YkgJ family cysteine cluster protein [Myxococcota bacterium]